MSPTETPQPLLAPFQLGRNPGDIQTRQAPVHDVVASVINSEFYPQDQPLTFGFANGRNSVEVSDSSSASFNLSSLTYLQDEPPIQTVPVDTGVTTGDTNSPEQNAGQDSQAPASRRGKGLIDQSPMVMHSLHLKLGCTLTLL